MTHNPKEIINAGVIYNVPRIIDGQQWGAIHNSRDIIDGGSIYDVPSIMDRGAMGKGATQQGFYNDPNIIDWK